MVENGSSGGAGPLPPSESHDGFLELCAIATSGSLTAAERIRLARHLSECADCRAVLAQYEALIGRVIPALASETSSHHISGTSSEWSPENVEAALFRRLDADEGPSKNDTPRDAEEPLSAVQIRSKSSFAGDLLWRHVWWQFAAGLLLLAALGFSVYRVGIQHGVESARQISPALAPTPSVPAPSSHETVSDPDPRAGDQELKSAQIAALRAQLDLKSEEIARLMREQVQLKEDLADKETERSGIVQEESNLAKRLELAQTNLQGLQEQLDFATTQGSADAAKTAALREEVDELTNSMHDRDQEIAQEQELLDHDRDIRELMGSRDLYIAEVYDVAKTGDTQKPFGRVFYTKGKSLVFYAYDLDQQPGIKNANTFQAWGRRGPDRDHAVNLGIFYQDNANKKRWVLKSTNPKTLAQIDAVFVTVEPNGGSSHPSGNPLLFAYLRIEPNHP